MAWNESMNLRQRILRCHRVRLLRSSEQRLGGTLDMALINAVVDSMTRRLALGLVIDRSVERIRYCINQSKQSDQIPQLYRPTPATF
jgi:hypothetical protein